MATTPKLVGPADPALIKSFETQTPSVARTSPPTVSATGTATSTGGTISRSIAPSTSGDTTTYTQATQASSGTELFIVSSNNNDSNDIVTVYNTQKEISVSAVNQTINNYKVTNTNTYGNSNVAAFLPTYDGNLSSGNLSVTGVSQLGAVGNIIISGGNNGQVLSTNGSGVLSWVTQSGGGNANTGNWEFLNNTMYNMAGGEINNGDPTHGATSGLVIPNNGNAGGGTSLFNTYGNIQVSVANLANTANTSVWNFGVDGNLTLPNIANASINYANGDPYGGGANTGNVTFDDINIIGTGNLHLQPDPANASSYLDIFLTSGPDLHLVASASANLILGKDNGANVMTSWDGNAYVQSWNQDTGTQGGVWTFSGDGSTVFPTLTVDLHNGGNQTAQTLQFGDTNQQAIITGPTPSANVNAQRLIVQGQRGTGGEGGDVYVWGGDSDINGGDIKIYAGDSDGATGSGGYINLAGGAGADNAGYVNIDGGYSANGYGGYININGGSSGSGIGGNINIQAGQSGGGNINGANILLQGGYSQSANGGAVTVRGGQSALGLSGYGNVLVEAGSSQWTFDNTGNLTLPTNTFAVNYANGTQVSIGGSNVTLPLANGDSNFNIAVANGNATITSNSTSTWTFDNTGNLNTAGDIVGPAGANFTIYSNAAAHEFIFADDGTFYAPDNVVLGGNSIYIGPGANTLAGIEHEVLLASSNNFAYVQGVINNVSDNGSAEWVALGAKGDDSGGWGEVGFTSSGFGDANYTITGAGDGYVFAQAYAPGSLAPAVGGGNLVLATGNQGTTKDIIFGTGGFLTGNIFGRISHANNSLELSRTNSNLNLSGGGGIIGSGNLLLSTNSNTWNFDTAGNLTLPTISLGSGIDEQTVIQSQRKIIPSFRWSAVISGTTPTVVYTATDLNTTSMKVAMQVQHTGLGFEMFDVSATSTGGNTYYTVSNRLQPPTISNSTVLVDLNGSNEMQITVTVNSGATTSWVTYDSTEFGIPQD